MGTQASRSIPLRLQTCTLHTIDRLDNASKDLQSTKDTRSASCRRLPWLRILCRSMQACSQSLRSESRCLVAPYGIATHDCQYMLLFTVCGLFLYQYARVRYSLSIFSSNILLFSDTRILLSFSRYDNTTSVPPAPSRRPPPLHNLPDIRPRIRPLPRARGHQ